MSTDHKHNDEEVKQQTATSAEAGQDRVLLAPEAAAEVEAEQDHKEEPSFHQSRAVAFSPAPADGSSGACAHTSILILSSDQFGI